MQNALNSLRSLIFNEEQYVANKTAALNVGGGSWTTAGTRQAFADNGLTAWEHFIKYGAFETNAQGGLGINPGDYMQLDKYYTDKAAHDNYFSQTNTATKDTIVEAFKNHGFDPISHYALYGYAEGLVATPTGTSDIKYGSAADYGRAVYFDEQIYLTNKTAALNAEGGSWTIESTRKAITDSGMTAWDHYTKYGAYEQNAQLKTGINPSSYFDLNKYYTDKLAATPGYTMSSLLDSFKASALDPITHFMKYGYTEGLNPTVEGLTGIKLNTVAQNIPKTGNMFVDTLLYPQWKEINNWNELGVKQGNVIYYTFMKEKSELDGLNFSYSNQNPMALTEVQQKGYIQALEAATKVTGIVFKQAAKPSDANMYFLSADLGKNLGETQCSSTNQYKVAVTVNHKLAVSTDPTWGKPAFATVVHELGHALGLKHPHKEMDGQKPANPPYTDFILPSFLDTTLGTIMSYNNAHESGNPWMPEGSRYYSPYDILALQHLYGTDGLNGNEGIIYGSMPDVQIV